MSRWTWLPGRVRELAQERGLSRRDVADALGVHPRTVRRWLAGSVPRGQRLSALCDLLDVPVGELFESPVRAVDRVHWLGGRLRAARIGAGVSVEDAAATAGVSARIYRAWESPTVPDAAQLTRLCGRLRVSADSLTVWLRATAVPARAYAPHPTKPSKETR